MKTLFFENTAPRISEREAERHLAQEVGQVLGHQPCDNLYWQGSTTDLMEALHLAYTSFRLTDAEGLCLSFAYIVDRGCARPIPTSWPREAAGARDCTARATCSATCGAWTPA